VVTALSLISDNAELLIYGDTGRACEDFQAKAGVTQVNAVG
jgi:hypothetical protein